MKRPFAYVVLAIFLVWPLHRSYAFIAVDSAPLCVVTKSGAHFFSVEIARSNSEKAMGLMFRERMNPEQGMLFIYNPPRQVAMWMKNTFIPLDLVFIQKRGTVANIVHGAVPHDLTPRPSTGRVGAVLELAAGVAKSIDLKAGDYIYHPSLSVMKDMPDACQN